MALEGIPRGRELGPPPAAAARGRQAWLPLPRSLRRLQAPRSNDFALTAPPRTEEARPRLGPPSPSVGAHPRAPSPAGGLFPGQSPGLRRPAARSLARLRQRRPAPPGPAHTLPAAAPAARAPPPRPCPRAWPEASATARTAERRLPAQRRRHRHHGRRPPEQPAGQPDSAHRAAAASRLSPRLPPAPSPDAARYL